MTATNNGAPASKPAPKLLGNRTRDIPLEYPVEWDGVKYETIRISRLSAEQFSVINEALLAGETPDLNVMLDAPKEVLDAIDRDDVDTINKAITDFLPRALRVVEEPTLPSTDPTSPTAPASSEAASQNTSAATGTT